MSFESNSYDFSPRTEEKPQIWDVEDLSRYLRCSKGHIYNLVSKEKIPFKKVGGLLRFIPLEIQNWVLEG
ncbi:MAG: helix-turn-helix domain-containing protein [Bacteriovoracaceae bacterium]|nr:helix-turn-helix domain-containing protein [Bacteriovoracaceae bacterium]